MFPSFEKESSLDSRTIPGINLDSVESVSALVKYIGEHSEIFESIAPSQNLGEQQILNSGDGGDFKLLSIDEMAQLCSSHVSARDVTMSDLFKPSQRTMIFGDSNVGKSYVMQDIALAFATGDACFCFHKSKPVRIVYLDGEMGDSFFPRMTMLSGGDLDPLVKNNLKVMSLRGRPLGNLKSTEIVIHKIEEYRPNLVIADNIISLFGEAVKGNVAPLKSFVETLEKIGIAVVLAHHTGKSAETYKGPIELEALCQNVIHLKGRQQIQDEFAKEALSMPPRMAALMVAKEIGPLVSMSFKKCKICPEFEKLKNYFYLPINGQWSPLDLEGASNTYAGWKNDATDAFTNTGLPVLENVTSDTTRFYDSSPDTGTKDVTTSPIELTYEQREILDAAKKFPISNKDVRKILDCSESKASRLLKELVEANLLLRNGHGPATKYDLVG